MQIISKKISIAELQAMAEKMFGNFVKAVVDIRRKVMAVDAELHADEEVALLEDGSSQQDLWGINLYPGMDPQGPDFVEFDSMINLRPSQNNRSRGVDDPEKKKEILSVVRELVK
jgi:hypothetical protein